MGVFLHLYKNFYFSSRPSWGCYKLVSDPFVPYGENLCHLENFNGLLLLKMACIRH
jgi:hypothetical protein